MASALALIRQAAAAAGDCAAMPAATALRLLVALPATAATMEAAVALGRGQSRRVERLGRAPRAGMYAAALGYAVGVGLGAVGGTRWLSEAGSCEAPEALAMISGLGAVAAVGLWGRPHQRRARIAQRRFVRSQR